MLNLLQLTSLLVSRLYLHTYIIVAIHKSHSSFYLLFLIFQSYFCFSSKGPIGYIPNSVLLNTKSTLEHFRLKRKDLRTIVYVPQILPLYIYSKADSVVIQFKQASASVLNVCFKFLA